MFCGWECPSVDLWFYSFSSRDRFEFLLKSRNTLLRRPPALPPGTVGGSYVVCLSSWRTNKEAEEAMAAGHCLRGRKKAKPSVWYTIDIQFKETYVFT